MRSADAEPNNGEACMGPRMLSALSAPRTDPLIMIDVQCNAEAGERGQAGWLAQLPSKERSYFQLAQTIRASRLARATVALF